MSTIPQRLRELADHGIVGGGEDTVELLREAAAALEAPVADAVPVAAEYPAGAVENGRAYAARLESSYQFECEAGPLSNCSDWHDLIRCFEHLAEWPANHLAAIAALQTQIASMKSSPATDAAPELPKPYDLQHDDAVPVVAYIYTETGSFAATAAKFYQTKFAAERACETFGGEAEALIRQRDHLATVAALQARIKVLGVK